MTRSRSWGSSSAARRWMTLAVAASVLSCAAAAQAQKPGAGLAGTPSMEVKADFLLLHGAWHVGDAWRGVITVLSKAGHRAIAIDFPGHGKSVKRGNVTFRDYEEALVAALNGQARPVILVGHSAAGVVMQAAAPRAADKVAALVVHNAFLLADGQSMIEIVPPKIAAAFRAAASSSLDNSLPVDEGFIRNVLMAGESKAVTDFVLSRLVPQPFGYYTHKIATGPFDAMGKPRYLLLATEDNSLPQAVWRGMARALGEHKTIEILGGHEVLYTNPEAVARGLATIARDLGSP